MAPKTFAAVHACIVKIRCFIIVDKTTKYGGTYLVYVINRCCILLPLKIIMRTVTDV